MKYLNKFNTFNPLNEDKTSRAERKLKKASELLDDIENAMNSGNDKKAERLMKRVARKIDNAENLDPSVDSEEISNKLIDLKSEFDDSKENPDDEFDINSKENRDKIKLDDFEIINKIKIKGDGISNIELQSFLKATKTYLSEYWNELKNNDNFPNEYQSPYNDFIIKVKRNAFRTVFFYKEGNITDKIKLVFNNDDFDSDDFKNKIESEIDDVLDSENVQKEIVDNYDTIKDDKVFEPAKEVQYSAPIISNEVINKTEKVFDILTTRDDNFINESVKLLINEKLNVGSSNTDEDVIFDFFVKKNSNKTIVAENINNILINYKKKKSTMNESWYNNSKDFEDATIGATKRASQSIISQPSKGVVGDLMWAFNTDAKTLSNDINQILIKLGSAYQKELNKSIDNLKNIKTVKESLDNSSLLSGILASGYAMNKYPQLAKFIGAKGGASTGATVARGGLSGVSRLGGLLANPYVWIGIAVIGAALGGWYLWNSFDEQQNQLATILLLMWASGSMELQNEFKKNGIVIKAPNIDITKLNDLIKNGELFKQETDSNSNPNQFENKNIKSFNDFKY